MPDEPPAFSADELPDAIDRIKQADISSSLKSQALDSVLASAFQDLSSKGDFGPDEQKKWGKITEAAREKISPDLTTKGWEKAKDIGGGTVDIAKGLAKDVGTAFYVLGSTFKNLSAPPMEMEDAKPPDLSEAKTFGQAASHDVVALEVPVKEWLARQFGAGSELDKSFDVLKKRIDDGEIPLKSGDTIKAWVDRQSAELQPVVFQSYAKEMGEIPKDQEETFASENSISRNPAAKQLLAGYIATRNPAIWDQFKTEAGKTPERAALQENQADILNSPGSQNFDKVFGKGASQHFLSAANPWTWLLASRLGRGVAAIVGGEGIAGRMAATATEIAPLGAAQTIQADPNASVSKVIQGAAETGVEGALLSGGVGLAGRGVNRLVNGAPKPAETPQAAPVVEQPPTYGAPPADPATATEPLTPQQRVIGDIFGDTPATQAPESATEPEPVTPPSNESIPRPTSESPGSTTSSPSPEGETPAQPGLRDENNAPQAAEVPAQQAGGDGGITQPAPSVRDRNAALRAADPSVFSPVKNLQVANAVVSNLPVDVVNMFGGKEGAAQVLLHHPSVFQDALTVYGNLDISEGGIDSAKSRVAALRAKFLEAKSAGGNEKVSSALSAFDGNISKIAGLNAPDSLQSGVFPNGQGSEVLAPSGTKPSGLGSVEREIELGSTGETASAGHNESIASGKRSSSGGNRPQDIREVAPAQPAPSAEASASQGAVEPTAASSSETPSGPAESQPSQVQSTSQGGQGQNASAAPTAKGTPRKKPFSIRQRKITAPKEAPPPEAVKPAPAKPPAPQALGRAERALQTPAEANMAKYPLSAAHSSMVKDALLNGDPVKASNFAEHGIKMPDSYEVGPDGIARKKPTVAPAQVAPDDPLKDAFMSAIMPDILNLGDPAPRLLKQMGDSMAGDESAGPGVWQKVKGELGTWAGQTFPKTTLQDRVAGEKAARWISSKIAAPFLSDTFVQKVAGDDPEFDYRKFGAALTEDNLRSVKSNFLKSGKPDDAAKVGTVVGSENSPFASEQEYQAYLSDPSIVAALARHKALWSEGVEPMYKKAMTMDHDTPLDPRGLQTGARVNLLAVKPGEPVRKPVSTVGSGNLMGTLRKKSPFGMKAKGTGTYDVDYRNMMANTYGRQLEVANKNDFETRLVETGNAVISKPGQHVKLANSEETEAFPLKRQMLMSTKNGGKTLIPLSQSIYIRKSLAGEYQRGSNIERWPIPTALKATASVLNKSALAGLTDATVHLTNLATVLFTRPVGEPLVNALAATFGRADIPIVLTKALTRGLKESKTQLTELAEIGALREDYPSKNPMHKLIMGMDRNVRLVMDDTFKTLASKGIVENTETARREFVNQVGQYNKRAQGDFMTLFRQTVAPFATAGRNFNVLGARTATLNPGVKATGAGASMVLKANMLSKWIGAATFIGMSNYLLTKDKGGGVLGRPGVKIGYIDTGKNDANGRPLAINVLDIVGLGRGLRVTGARGVMESYRNKLSAGDMVDSAVRDIYNSSISPFTGPIVKFGFGLGNTSPAYGVQKPFPVAPPGDSQLAHNFVNSLKEANPLIASYFDMQKPGATKFDWMRRQLPRFTLTPGNPSEMMEHYPEIVRKAQAHAFVDDVIGRARKMDPEVRAKYIQDSINQLDPADRKHALDEMRHRRVMR